MINVFLLPITHRWARKDFAGASQFLYRMPCLNEHQHDASCDHSNDDPNRGIESSLFNQIDFESIRCSNAIDASVCPKIFKTYENRFDTTIELQSDDDEQLLIYVPFISNVKLKSIAIMGTPGFAPSHLRAFINKDDLDFESATSSIPTQEFDLISDHPRGTFDLCSIGARISNKTYQLPQR